MTEIKHICFYFFKYLFIACTTNKSQPKKTQCLKLVSNKVKHKLVRQTSCYSLRLLVQVAVQNHIGQESNRLQGQCKPNAMILDWVSFSRHTHSHGRTGNSDYCAHALTSVKAKIVRPPTMPIKLAPSATAPLLTATKLKY